MPPKSEAQRRAMQAAAKGKSTIGIPKSVGQEYAASDKGEKLPRKIAQSTAQAVRDTKRRNMDE